MRVYKVSIEWKFVKDEKGWDVETYNIVAPTADKAVTSAIATSKKGESRDMDPTEHRLVEVVRGESIDAVAK